MLLGRLPWLTIAELDDGQRQIYNKIIGGVRANRVTVDENGRLPGQLNALLFLNPAIGEWLQGLGGSLRWEFPMTDRSREIVTLVIANAVQSNFVWAEHARHGKSAGLSDAEIDGIAAGCNVDSFDESECVLANVARSIALTDDIDEQLFDRALDQVGRETLMNMIVIVGYYRMLAAIIRIWHVPARAGATNRFAL